MPPRKRTRASVKREPSPAESDVSVISVASSAFKPGSASSAASEAESAYESTPEPQPKKRKAGRATPKKPPIAKVEIGDIEDGPALLRPHGRSYHDIKDVVASQDALLQWFESVRETRGMPWRKRYDREASMEAKGQRAYEIWVSEVMLQQTQVATVIAYWKRWMERWPTIADLASADIEEVNAAWRGLGYYRRAKSLLEGAKAVMANKKFDGRLPSDPEVLEKQIPGVGRYTAGAIASMAYGVRTPIVDGNIHRVLTRLLAVHATQTAPATIRFLWDKAEALVDALPRGMGKGLAGDWNQGLMELGATVCRPIGPDCTSCPLRPACHAHAELSAPPPNDGDPCELCASVPCDGHTIPSVTVFPMRKEKKASRVEHEVVCITEWAGPEGRRWLLVKRPEKGLLAGLFEPPTIPVAADADKLAAGLEGLGALLGTPMQELGAVTHTEVAPVPHIFSHIDMTYHVQHLVIETDAQPPTPDRGAWLTADEVEAANVGTGVKKVWAAAYGAWGKTERTKAAAKSKPKAKPRAKAAPKRKAPEPAEGKVTRKVMMPIMPQK